MEGNNFSASIVCNQNQTERQFFESLGTDFYELADDIAKHFLRVPCLTNFISCVGIAVSGGAALQPTLATLQIGPRLEIDVTVGLNFAHASGHQFQGRVKVEVRFTYVFRGILQ